MKMRPVALIPDLKHHIWGGTTLSAEYGKSAKEGHISESWELSCRQESPTRINDMLSPGTLFETLKKHGWKETIGSSWNSMTDFPLLVKFIDARMASPITVCPSMAEQSAEQNNGAKLIYITDCKADSFIYHGVCQAFSADELLAKAKNGSIIKSLKSVSVKKGDAFLIEAGTIYGLGAGCTALEIRQNNSPCYTVYNYDRAVSEDEISISELENIAETVELSPSKKIISIGHIAKTPFFTVDRFRCGRVLTVDKHSFALIVCLDGEGTINHQKDSLSIKKGFSVFLPANTGDYQLKGSAQGLIITL